MQMRPTTRRLAVTAAVGTVAAVTLAVPFGAPALAATAQVVDDTQNACPPDQVPPAGFTDIAGDTFENEINCIADYGITKGVDDTHYVPQRHVNRAEMATFIYRLLQYAGKAPTDVSPVGFTDIQAYPQPMQDAINALAHGNVVNGRDAQHYLPADDVRRDEMAAFIDRAQDLIDAGYAANGDYFSDDMGDVFEQQINAIATAGIVQGTTAGHYSPAASVTRSDMAGFLARDLEVNVERGNIPSPYPAP